MLPKHAQNKHTKLRAVGLFVVVLVVVMMGQGNFVVSCRGVGDWGIEMKVQVAGGLFCSEERERLFVIPRGGNYFGPCFCLFAPPPPTQTPRRW